MVMSLQPFNLQDLFVCIPFYFSRRCSCDDHFSIFKWFSLEVRDSIFTSLVWSFKFITRIPPIPSDFIYTLDLQLNPFGSLCLEMSSFKEHSNQLLHIFLFLLSCTSHFYSRATTASIQSLASILTLLVIFSKLTTLHEKLQLLESKLKSLKR